MNQKVILIVAVLLLFGIWSSGCVNKPEPKNPDDHGKIAIEIPVDSVESPIRKYFTTQKILWTFDDYSIQYNHNPPHKGFGGLTDRINSYGGFVQLMVIFTTETYTKPFGNELRNYSVINDFGYSPSDIAASLEFFSRPNVEVGSHGWNHTGNLSYVNQSFAFKMINFTMWNWKNNYNITPHFFLGPGTSGNYNITLALKRFSERYWTVYGENFKWYNAKLFPNASRSSPAVEYIDKPSYVVEFDPLFGESWGTPCKNVTEAKNLYNRSSVGKEILFVRGHPSFLNGTNQKAIENLSFWEQWIDWIYQTHELININHIQAIHYNMDRTHFKVVKNNEENFTIDLTNCSYNHSVLFSKPLNSTKKWAVFDEEYRFIKDISDDTFIEISPGSIYYFLVK
jgi:hypothetical protein